MIALLFIKINNNSFNSLILMCYIKKIILSVVIKITWLHSTFKTIEIEPSHNIKKIIFRFYHVVSWQMSAMLNQIQYIFWKFRLFSVHFLWNSVHLPYVHAQNINFLQEVSVYFLDLIFSVFFSTFSVHIPRKFSIGSKR